MISELIRPLSEFAQLHHPSSTFRQEAALRIGLRRKIERFLGGENYRGMQLERPFFSAGAWEKGPSFVLATRFGNKLNLTVLSKRDGVRIESEDKIEISEFHRGKPLKEYPFPLSCGHYIADRVAMATSDDPITKVTYTQLRFNEDTEYRESVARGAREADDCY